MIYRNEQQQQVSFKAGGLTFDVPPGGEVDIPPNLTHVVSSRGLLLVPGSNGGARVEAEAQKAASPRLPPGIEAGTAPDVPDDDVDVDRGAPAVSAAVEKLRAEGVNVGAPKGKRR